VRRVADQICAGRLSVVAAGVPPAGVGGEMSLYLPENAGAMAGVSPVEVDSE